MKYRVTVLPGDGIGPEVTDATLHVLKALDVPISFEKQPLGMRAFEQCGRLLPPDTIASIGQTRVALKGPTETPIGEGHRSVNVELRELFQLYLNVRPVRTMPGIQNRFSDVKIDIVVFRENTEDCYIGEEWEIPRGAKSIAEFTFAGVERFARRAFEYMDAHGRKRVTIGHKANILKKTHGLFLQVARKVAAKHWACLGMPLDDLGIVNDLIADNLMLQLVRNPERFDCLLLPNFLGDLVSDLCAGLVGGLGFAPGANIGDDCAIFEAVHGTAPDIAGKGIANPTAMILSAAMMLDHLGEGDVAGRIRHAIDQVLIEGRFVTKDVSPKSGVSTTEYTDALIRAL